MRTVFWLLMSALCVAVTADGTRADHPFERHGRLRVAPSKTYLEHADGTPFFVLADTCWSGPALSSESEWNDYLQDRVRKGFTAIQFNMASPWRCTPTDAEGAISYKIQDGVLIPNETYYQRVDARLRAINQAGLLAIPVLAWAHTKGDLGKELTESQLITLIQFEVQRYRDAHVLWILAGDNSYGPADAAKWKRIGRAVFGALPHPLVTTHPTGENWPWESWEEESWLTVLGYQSGHGDSEKTMRWLTSGPPATYGQKASFRRPVLNLEPPYEGHNGYSTRRPHTEVSVRRAIYWSLLVHPPAGVTYGGHGVWSWHLKPGQEPVAHSGTGVAKVWNEALDLPAAQQLKHLRGLLDRIPWTTLRPAMDLITESPTDPALFSPAARAADGTIVVYFAPNTTAKLKLAAFDASRATWYNPRNGEFSPAKTTTPPDRNDWLLIVKP